jgi:hypothetical protein
MDVGVPEMCGDGAGLQGCGHDNDTKIRTKCAMAIQGQGKACISSKAAFMKFIKDNKANVREFWVIEQTLGEEPLGENLNTCMGAATPVQANMISDGIADSLLALLGHVGRSATCGKTAGFQHEDLFAVKPWRIEEKRGNTRRLP